jgi:hypothetical protein
MTFYGLVDAINVESGFYGRKEGINELKKNGESIIKDLIKNHPYISGAIIAVLGSTLAGLAFMASFLYTLLKGTSNQKSLIIKLSKLEVKNNSENQKMIIIANKGLAGNYNTNGENFLFGLFKTNEQFETIMKSQGNSNLIIFERDNLPDNIKHFGDVKGKFNYGLYCEHPKDSNILIPLLNYNELIKSIILEESLRVFSKLGAKSMLIEDITEVDVTDKLNTPSVNADVNVNVKTEKLREKEFGDGIFIPDQALNDTYFVYDYPNIMTVIDSRINGNQTREEFTETININAGLDIDVLKVFKNKLNFKYDRKWHFKVEFYDKSKL